MHLALFTSEFPSQVQTYLLWDLSALLNAGFEITIFPVRPPDAAQWKGVTEILTADQLERLTVRHVQLNLLKSLQQIRLRLSYRPVLDIVGVARSAARFGLLPLIKSLIAVFEAGCILSEPLPKFDYVLSYWGNYPATYAYLVHRWSGLKVPFSILLHAGTDLYRDQVYLEQKLLYADQVFTVCDFNRQFIQSIFPQHYSLIQSKISIHQLGLDLTAFPCQLQGRESRTILAVGRLDKRKGFDYLLLAAAELQKMGQAFSLEIVGSGPEAANLKALAQRLHIAGTVSFTGWLPLSEVRTKMRTATLLVHSSSSIGDAVPTVIKEAMATGLPVVASRVAGIPELLDNGRCGVLVPPASLEALAMAIKELLIDESVRLKYARLARQHAEATFDLDQTSKHFIQKILSAAASC